MNANVSSSDLLSQNPILSVTDTKTSKQDSRDADGSTLSSERVLYTNQKRKNPGEVHGGGCNKQLKSDSSSSKNSSDASMKSSSCFGFDLNECIEESEPDWHCRSSGLSEPIPVVAKVGVPIGVPEKPLQFCGALGWKRSGFSSAFRSNLHGSSRGFDLDLNVVPAAATHPESPVNAVVKQQHSETRQFLESPVNAVNAAASLYVKQQHSETRQFSESHVNAVNAAAASLYVKQQHSETRQFLESPVNAGSLYAKQQHSETRQFLQNFDTVGTVRPPYWVDLSSVQGPPAAPPFQMMVPIQLPYTPPALYYGKINSSASPTFYPHAVLSPHIRLMENPQVLNNPHGYAAGNNPEGFRVEQVVGPASLMKRRELGLLPGTLGRRLN